MSSLRMEVVRTHPDAVLPYRAYETDAGMDLVSVDEIEIQPGDTQDIGHGLRIGVPPGWHVEIVGRSSTMRKRGLLVIPGVIDAGYRGELYSCVTNLNSFPVMINFGDRLAQMLFRLVPMVHVHEVGELSPSERGENGFGSSGR